MNSLFMPLKYTEGVNMSLNPTLTRPRISVGAMDYAPTDLTTIPVILFF